MLMFTSNLLMGPRRSRLGHQRVPRHNLDLDIRLLERPASACADWKSLGNSKRPSPRGAAPIHSVAGIANLTGYVGRAASSRRAAGQRPCRVEHNILDCEIAQRLEVLAVHQALNPFPFGAWTPSNQGKY